MNTTYSYELIKSSRKTISIELKQDGSLLVRAPYRMRRSLIDAFVEDHRAWIEKARQRQQAKQKASAALPDTLTPERIAELTREAKKVIPERVAFFAARMGVTYGRITIRHQTSRWGSCSSKGNLNFNCLLMLCPESVLDYVVVHELAHRKEMNHSAAFWHEVASILPDYREQNAWLRKNGTLYIRNMKENA